MQRLTLFSTSGCHLCESAAAIVAEVSPQVGGIALEIVDIAESEALFERYGLLIPVLRHANGDELKWPFAAVSLRAFLREKQQG